MTGETPSSPEQNETAAEYAQRLHGGLTALLLQQGRYAERGDGHYARLVVPGGAVFVASDYHSDELEGYPARPSGDTDNIYARRQTFRRQALENGTAIIDVRAEDKSQYPELSSIVVLKPTNAVNNVLLVDILTPAGIGMQTDTYIVTGRCYDDRNYSAITNPEQFPLLADLEQALPPIPHQ